MSSNLCSATRRTIVGPMTSLKKSTKEEEEDAVQVQPLVTMETQRSPSRTCTTPLRWRISRYSDENADDFCCCSSYQRLNRERFVDVVWRHRTGLKKDRNIESIGLMCFCLLSSIFRGCHPYRNFLRRMLAQSRYYL